MLEAILIPLFVCMPIIALLIVVIVLSVIGTNQHLTENVNGHTVEVRTGYGYSQLLVDGNIVDEIRSLYMYTAKLQGVIDGVTVVSNIGVSFCKYRITTFVNGNRSTALSN